MDKLVTSIRISLFFIGCFVCHEIAHATPPTVHDRISFSVTNKTIESTIEQLESQSDLSFSYNPELFPIDSIISLTLTDVSIETALHEILGEHLHYRVIGDIVILRYQQPETKSKKKTISVAGAIRDKNSGKTLPDATVLMVEGKYSAQSSSEGFDLDLNSKTDYVELYISKENYRDTVLFVPSTQKEPIDIELTPISATEAIKIDTTSRAQVEDLALVQLTLPKQHRTFTENLALYSADIPGQISVLPFIGTNLMTNSVSTNTFSLNVLAGYAGGVEGAEVGGLMNIVRGDVKGVQIGGLMNVVGGTVQGVQIGGLANNNRHNVEGVQIAGLYNAVLDSISGVQFAGLLNVNHGKVDGWQFAGIANGSTGELEGFQLAGILNVSGNSLDGFQLAGIANLGRGDSQGGQISGYANVITNMKGPQITGGVNASFGEMEGLQLAGMVNLSGKEFTGTQLAGIANLSYGDFSSTRIAGVGNISLGNGKGTEIAPIGNITFKDNAGVQGAGIFNATGQNMQGWQVASLINYTGKTHSGVQLAAISNQSGDLNGFQLSLLNKAKDVKGAQLGLINKADTVKGASVGLLSFVKKGYKAIELSAGDTYLPKVSLKMGTPWFYNIVSFGSTLKMLDTSFSMVGYGVGIIKQIKQSKWSVSSDATAFALLAPDDDKVQVGGSLTELELNVKYAITPRVTLFSGPSIYFSNYAGEEHISHIPVFTTNGNKGFWVGYHLGVSVW